MLQLSNGMHAWRKCKHTSLDGLAMSEKAGIDILTGCELWQGKEFDILIDGFLLLFGFL